MISTVPERDKLLVMWQLGELTGGHVSWSAHIPSPTMASVQGLASDFVYEREFTLVRSRGWDREPLLSSCG